MPEIMQTKRMREWVTPEKFTQGNDSQSSLFKKLNLNNIKRTLVSSRSFFHPNPECTKFSLTTRKIESKCQQEQAMFVMQQKIEKLQRYLKQQEETQRLLRSELTSVRAEN